MQSLFDQLSALQHMPRAYEEWAAYRAALTDFIEAHTEPNAAALIVGAGPCNDFDLIRLVRHFSPLVLMDRNTQSISEGLARQSINADAVTLVKADLLGISDEAYRAMDSVLLEEIRRQTQRGALAPERFEQLLTAQMQAALRARTPTDLHHTGVSADYVICCGVHSQLLNPLAQAVGVYRRYIPFDSERVLAMLSAENGDVVRELNAALFRLANAGVLLGLETGRAGTDSGIEGAAQALSDIQPRCVRRCPTAHLRWPFDAAQGKAYNVAVMLLPSEKNACAKGGAPLFFVSS